MKNKRKWRKNKNTNFPLDKERAPLCLYIFKLIKINSPREADGGCLPGLEGCLLGVYGAKFSGRRETGPTGLTPGAGQAPHEGPFLASGSALFKARWDSMSALFLAA